MSYKYGPSIVTDGLVFYVDAANSKSYPGTGTALNDLIGSEDMTMRNQASVTGSMIEMDGIDDYVDISSNYVPTHLQFNFNDPFTISAWCRADFSATSGPATAVGSMEYSGNFKSCAIINGPINDRLKPRFWLRDSGSQFTLITSTSFAMTQGQDHNVTFTYSGSRSSSSWKMYVDGVDTAITYSNTGSATSINYTGASFAIGTREATESFWQGGVGPVQIYNKSLTSAEVTQNYNALKNRFV